MSNEAWLNLSQVVAFVGAVLAAAGVLGSHIAGRRSDAERDANFRALETERDRLQAQAGVLRPRVLLDPTRVLTQFEFGNSGAGFRFADGEGTPLFQLAEHNDLSVREDKGQLKLSTTIRNRDGNVVARIIDNEWQTNPDAAWDRNYTDDALEVIDPAGDVVLQVRLLPDRVQFQAKMYDRTGRGIALGEMIGPDGEVGGGIELTGPEHPDLRMKITPLFLYPSSLHLGQLAAPKSEH